MPVPGLHADGASRVDAMRAATTPVGGSGPGQQHHASVPISPAWCTRLSTGVVRTIAAGPLHLRLSGY